MSQDNKKPKAFLKKGTRQFLSNATVRSLNQKPKIVDFEDENNDIANIKPSNNFKHNTDEIKIQVKSKMPPKNQKQFDQRSTEANVSHEVKRSKQNKITCQESNIRSSNSTKKKSVFEDYLGAKKQMPKQNLSHEKNNNQKIISRNDTKLSTMALKRQDEDLNSDEQNQIAIVKQQKIAPSVFKKQIKSSNLSNKKTFSKKISDSDEQDEQKIIFNSDSQNDEKVKKKQIGSKYKQDFKQKEKQTISTKNIQEKQSKILQKYYNRAPEISSNDKSNQLLVKQKLTIQDIPIELKKQIIDESIAQKAQDFKKKLNELQNTIQIKKKQQQKFQEENRKLIRQKEVFYKQMEEKNKQFEQKIKTQNSKLTREKKYMKDQQTTGKADWRIKNEVEQLRNKLDQCQNEKKKIKAELTRQVQRLRKKLEEQIQQKQSLKTQIKYIQMERVKQKQQIKQVKEQSKKIQKANFWANAPTRSFVSNFFEDNFSLINLKSSCYCFENLQYYQYYLSKKDEISELLSQQSDGTKILRVYKNGKEEVEYISKALKETFPFKFSIVHHYNGDVKMTLPQGVNIYFDNRNNITEFQINDPSKINYPSKTNHPIKIIHNFHNQDQIQMKVKDRNIHQLYKGGTFLIKNTPEGQFRYKRTEKGDIIQC